MPASSASLPVLSPPTLGSESDLLVARCLAEIRSLTGGEDVRLDPLPPLPAPGERRHAVVLARQELAAVPPTLAVPLPSPSAARAFAAGLVASPSADDVTAVSRRRQDLARSRVWVTLCALVAVVAALLAVARSPLRRRPVVTRAVAVSVAAAHAAAHVATDVIRFGEH